MKVLGKIDKDRYVSVAYLCGGYLTMTIIQVDSASMLDFMVGLNGTINRKFKIQYLDRIVILKENKELRLAIEEQLKR